MVGRRPYVATGRELEKQREVAQHGYRNPSDPKPGFFAVRIVRGGPLVPAALWYGQPADPLTGEKLDRSLRWRVFRNGEEITGRREPEDTVLQIWTYGRRITADQYRQMLEDAKNAPAGSALAMADRPIDLMTTRLPF